MLLAVGGWKVLFCYANRPKCNCETENKRPREVMKAAKSCCANFAKGFENKRNEVKEINSAKVSGRISFLLWLCVSVGISEGICNLSKYRIRWN